jgi:hypothetical protein
MQKLKINSLQGSDLTFFNNHLDKFEIVEHAAISDLQSSDGAILIDLNILRVYWVPDVDKAYILNM